ncbi:MAG TPA: response regulator [Methylomirabilota bacterium]|nr:response regulator [Methylomirabilota bacterium]
METILVVDDEPEIRALVRDILEPKGYDVLEARDGEDALTVASHHPGPIDLVLSDVVMPGLNGPDMAARLKPIRVAAKFVFMSGYTTEIVGQYGMLRSGAPFIAKPFAAEVLARKLREVLDYRSPFARPAPPASGPRPAFAGA